MINEVFRAAARAAGPEVLVADTDVVLGDACQVLRTGRPSELLRAIDAGTAIAFMSEQTFHEIGWMSAKSARGNDVDHEALRTLITTTYLPRIPVVSTPTPDDGQWMPDASDVTDPDDIAHVQVARLVAARAVYSHDRDLRRPGLAPPTREAYDRRLVHLSLTTDRAENERSIGMLACVTGGGTNEIVKWTSVRLKVRPATLWLGLTMVFAGTMYVLVSPPERRRRIADGLEPIIERIGTAIERSDRARAELQTTRLIPEFVPDRLEMIVASLLARRPELTMGEIGAELGLTTASRSQLSVLLRGHPVFERSSRYGWSVGRRRDQLATTPRTIGTQASEDVGTRS